MHGSFLQSPEWEQIHKEMGRSTWRVQGKLIVRHNLARGLNYLYCPRPEFGIIKMSEFIAEVSRVARTQKSLFLKIDPVKPLSFEGMRISKEENKPIQPQQTIVLDLSKSDTDLLAGMHEKTRYNIHLAERKEIEVTQVIRREVNEDLDIFWNLLAETAARGGFHPHEKRYYELLSRVRSSEISNEFFFVRMRNDHDTVLAAAMINFYRDPYHGTLTATYLHGASSSKHRELMAPHLLHWRIIQEAKQRGATAYDFWGIDEQYWPGITRFKMGFGGARVDYPKSVHIIYRRIWYRLYQSMRGKKNKKNARITKQV